MNHIDQNCFYICWTPNILPIIFDNGFKLWVDPEGKMNNPIIYMKPRYSIEGKLLKPSTGYIFERTPELMKLIGKHSRNFKKTHDWEDSNANTNAND